ncbi:MAG: (Fe-S)-binding protein [Cyclobacteriaceae bacterium]|nr:(Fe-S)-binding protein [Cyclobacteriaceae bacterium]
MTERAKQEGVVTMAEFAAKGESPEILLWIGCAGAYDERYKKVVRAMVSLLQMAEVSFGVLGPEESCTGDPARRAGNEFLFQMQAMANIQILNGYNVKKIVTACPHCFNTLKNEYPDLGGVYEVWHHTQFLTALLSDGRLNTTDAPDKPGSAITYHDSCYLGRSNGVYDAPRKLLEFIHAEKVEMDRHGKNAFCCGAGGAQMFKEPEKGLKDINIERTEEALRTGAKVIATACPFCMTMLSDGIKNKEMEETVKVLDVAELLLQANVKKK